MSERGYLETTYEARGLRIRIGDAVPELAVPWAFITAWNPRSKELPLEVNEQRNAALERELRGFEVHRGYGVPDDLRAWKPEASFLVLGIDEARAVALGRAYEQNAIVVGSPARLVRCLPR